jgi:transcriptional regulator with XRE-family HTH domain
MGRAKRPQPGRLADKVSEVRRKLGVSQNGMIRLMGLTDDLTQAEISAFERSIRVPPLPVLLEYARVANVYLEVLVDDELDLPLKLPSPFKHEGQRRCSSSKKKKR